MILVSQAMVLLPHKKILTFLKRKGEKEKEKSPHEKYSYRMSPPSDKSTHLIAMRSHCVSNMK